MTPSITMTINNAFVRTSVVIRIERVSQLILTSNKTTSTTSTTSSSSLMSMFVDALLFTPNNQGYTIFFVSFYIHFVYIFSSTSSVVVSKWKFAMVKFIKKPFFLKHLLAKNKIGDSWWNEIDMSSFRRFVRHKSMTNCSASSNVCDSISLWFVFLTLILKRFAAYYAHCWR